MSDLLHPVLWIILIALSTYRATRIVTRDKMPLIAVPRDAFVRRWGVYDDSEGDERLVSINGKKTNVVMSSLAYLWECDWCASIWLAIITWFTYMWPETMLWVMIALVASGVTGWLSKLEALADAKLKKLQ